MATLLVNINNEKITLTMDERLGLDQFKSIRSLGFLWSRYQNAFLFNMNKEGARRVGRLQYLVKNEDHMKNLEVTYESEEVENRITALLNEIKEEQQKALAEKKAKEEQANKNRYARYEKILTQLKELKNGFGTTNWDLSNSNYNLSDLMARSGVRVDYKAKELAEKFNINIEDTGINDSDILELSIRFGNNWERYSDKPSSRYLSFEVDHYTEDKSGLMSGGSGHYETRVCIENELTRIDFKKVIKISELVNDEVLENVIKNYIEYCKNKGGFTESYDALGIIKGHRCLNNYLETTFKTNCLNALGVNA